MNTHNLQPFKAGFDPRRNRTGRPKGALNLATWIRKLLNDESFELWLPHPTKGLVFYKGAPIVAIVTVAIYKAAAGDLRAAEWLAKHGYGKKVEIINESPQTLLEPSPIASHEFVEYLQARTKL